MHSWQTKIKEELHFAQAKAATDMAATSLIKAKMLCEAADLVVFNMKMESLDSDMSREFLALRRGQVMKWLQKRLAEEDAAEAIEVPNAAVSSWQQQRPSSPQGTLPTDDSDDHNDNIQGHCDDQYNNKEPLSEDIEPLDDRFSEFRISPTRPIHGHTNEWSIFQMLVECLESVGMPERFASAFTAVNHEVFA